MSQPATLLCFDYGTKRIGVAVGQTLTATATPLEIIPVRNNRPDWDRIGTLVRQWRPQALLVGNPLNIDGSRQPFTACADKFAGKLRGRFRLPVLRADERFSTAEARSRHGNKAHVDHIAAQVILEDWLQHYGEPQKML